MVYQRRQRNRRSKPRGPAKPRGYLDTATQALAVAYAVKKLINVEFHTKSTVFTTDPNSTGAVVNLTAIAQGDDIDDRQGNKLRLKYISCRGEISLNSSATNSRVRYAIVRDNNGSTTQPSIADVFVSAATFLSNKNKKGDPQANSRFTVLHDQYIYVNTDTPTKPFKWSMSLDHHVFFTGSASTDEGKGHVYLMIASNETTNDPVVFADAMVKWIDN